MDCGGGCFVEIVETHRPNTLSWMARKERAERPQKFVWIQIPESQGVEFWINERGPS